MSSIFEAIKKHNIVIKIPNHGYRLAVEIFPYKDGIVFFDVGWTEASNHPMHFVPGPIIDTDKSEYWELGDHSGGFNPDNDFQAWIFDRGVDKDLIGNNDTWERYKKSERGKKLAASERAYNFFKQNYLMDD